MTNEDSSAERSSAWKGWLLALVMVPVVYMLSVPPVVLVVLFDRKTGSYMGNEPAWLSWYAAPGDWVYTNVSVLQKPLSGYFDWCFKMYTGKNRR
jgi:hypothetical protein